MKEIDWQTSKISINLKTYHRTRNARFSILFRCHEEVHQEEADNRNNESNHKHQIHLSGLQLQTFPEQETSIDQDTVCN